MTSIISQFLSTLFPKREARVLFLGLDAAGKTTILYKLKLGEVVTTIPTIGFNVETVTHNGMSLTIWDVGGCDKIRPLWRHYYQNTEAVVFIVDANDRDRLLQTDESYKWGTAQGLFIESMKEDELRDVKILIYLNKQDLPDALSVEQFQQLYNIEGLVAQGLIKPHQYHIQPCVASRGDGLYEGLDWLVRVLREQKESQPVTPPPPPTPPSEVETDKKKKLSREEMLMTEWLQRVDDPDEIFLEKFHNYTLESWDHYTHLRIAWILLQRQGRREGLQSIFTGIKAFIENSPRTKPSQSTATATANRGTTFHETMTYFWTHMVHYAIVATKLPEPKNFKVFLLMNPQLTNGGLFLHYYSKQLMLLDVTSRQQVVLPDIKPLPSIISSSTSSESTTAAMKAMTLTPSSTQSLATMTDERFYELWTSQQLPSLGHEVKVRIIYLLLCQYGRAKGGVDQILVSLERMEGSNSHLTMNYFWIQMISYHIMNLIAGRAAAAAAAASKSKSQNSDGKWKKDKFGKLFVAGTTSTTSSEEGIDFSSATPFYFFWQEKSCEALHDSLYYTKYYSRQVIDSAEAKTSVQLPDIKPFPNIAVI